MPDFHVLAVRTEAQIGDARALFREYAAWLMDDFGVDLAFQGFASELDGLPGKYAPPIGELLLAYGEDGAAGSIAVRPFRERICEIKRLYVRPAARGTGLGRRLALAILDAARGLGYRSAVLDTGPFMVGAQKVYEALGFHDIPPYYANPYPGVRYLGVTL